MGAIILHCAGTLVASETWAHRVRVEIRPEFPSVISIEEAMDRIVGAAD